MNLGDSYASAPKGNPGNGMNGERFGASEHTYDKRNIPGVKPKDLVGIPWRVAFALQADGWYLRSDIIWAKPNPMPESVTDSPTKAHEYVFLLSKQPRYWFDQEAVREPQSTPYEAMRPVYGPGGGWVSGPQAARRNGGDNVLGNPAGRNVRSVWEIATQPYAEAHFATYPEELVRRCLLAGCPEWVCGTCGKARERIVEASGGTIGASWGDHSADAEKGNAKPSGQIVYKTYRREALGWSDCGHDNYRPGVVLDPFLGSGTTALVARNHGRRCVGIELSPEYAQLAAKRTRQLSLLA